MTSMPLYAPLFVEDRDDSSTLRMVNQLAATVIARTADGSIIGQRVVTFVPSSQQIVGLRDILQSGGVSEAVGYVQVVPNPMEVWTMGILAQLSIVGTEEFPPVYLVEELLSPDPMQATLHRATVPSSIGSPEIALLNTAAKEQTLSTTCVKADGERIRRNFALAASELVVVSACRNDRQSAAQTGGLALDTGTTAAEEGRAAAVEVSNVEGMGTFAAWGMAPARSADSHVSISLNFFNGGQAQSATSIFAGVPVGTTDLLGGEQFVPDLAVANFDSKATRVTVLLSAMSGDDPDVQTVADVIVEPGTVRKIELHHMSGDSALRNSFIVDSDGRPGAVISNLILRGERMYPAVQLIGKDGLDVNNSGGHPWSIANGDESTLLLFNHAAKPATFNVDIAAAGGVWRQTYELAANETLSIDLRHLVLDQVPDLDGKKLPSDATFGSASWFTNDAGKGAGRMLVSNPLAGLGRNFSCGGYLVLCGVGASTLSANIPVGGTATLGPLTGAMCISTSNPNACSGQTSGNNGSGFTYAWTSSNNSIAQVSGASTNASATFAGKSAGTAQSNGKITLGECSFPAQGTVNVIQVQITAADITQNEITVVLSGPASTSGNLNVQVTGPNGQSPVDPITNSTLGPGTYNYTFGLSNIPIGTYTTVTATWTVNGVAANATRAYTFEVMGTYVQTQYNTPYEGNCGGSPANITLWKVSGGCSSSAGSLLSNFINAVAAPGSGTGSGQSIHYGGVVPEQFCTSYSTTNYRDFYTITGTKGPLSNSSVAACPSSPLYTSGAQVYIVGEGTKTVTDSCPACCSNPGYAHLDNYTTSNACSGIGSLSNALTIWLNP